MSIAHERNRFATMTIAQLHTRLGRITKPEKLREFITVAAECVALSGTAKLRAEYGRLRNMAQEKLADLMTDSTTRPVRHETPNREGLTDEHIHDILDSMGVDQASGPDQTVVESVHISNETGEVRRTRARLRNGRIVGDVGRDYDRETREDREETIEDILGLVEDDDAESLRRRRRRDEVEVDTDIDIEDILEDSQPGVHEDDDEPEPPRRYRLNDRDILSARLRGIGFTNRELVGLTTLQLREIDDSGISHDEWRNVVGPPRRRDAEIDEPRRASVIGRRGRYMRELRQRGWTPEDLREMATSEMEEVLDEQISYADWRAIGIDEDISEDEPYAIRRGPSDDLRESEEVRCVRMDDDRPVDENGDPVRLIRFCDDEE